MTITLQGSLVLLATFLAASVEWVEALTIVLAVGSVRSWRAAVAGTLAALGLLAVLVLVFGTALFAYFPAAILRTVVGVFLLLFGIRWLHKAILRSAGLIALHDETKAFEETRRELEAEERGRARAGVDWPAATTSFNGVFLEGVEVIFIVIALGGLHSIPLATAGALIALAVVVAVGIALRQPLTRVPENTLKYVVGIMLTAFGTFFAGEGLGVAWWHEDVSLLPLIAGYGLASLLLVQLVKNPITLRERPPAAVRFVRGVAKEVWGLFVGDGALAILTVAVLLAAGIFVDRVSGQRELAGLLLALGVLAGLLVALLHAASGYRAKAAAAKAVATEAAPHLNQAAGARTPIS